MATVVVHPNFDLTARGVASRLVTHLVERQSLARPVHVSVTGGGLGVAIWPLIASDPLAGAVDWTGVHVWFSDERFVSAGDPDRNDGALLAHAAGLGLPPGNVHSIPGPDQVPDARAAADAYAATLAAWAGGGPGGGTVGEARWRSGHEAHARGRQNGNGLEDGTPGEAQHRLGDGVPTPYFDVSILGIGPDGHVASLFPGRSRDAEREESVIPVADAPKPPPERVSFTRRVLCHCDELWMIAAGADKACAVSRALSGDDPDRTPAAGVHGRRRTLWLVDSALADAIASPTL